MGGRGQMMETGDPVVIVGAGFSGTLLAINLMRHSGPRAILVERRADQLARGVAYSAANEEHLLNVRAANMSALPDDPDHFVRWLEEKGLGGGTTFIPRRVYGAYLREMLELARQQHGDRLTLIEGAATAVTHDGGGQVVTLADGTLVRAGTVVLALGNLPPHTPPGLAPDQLPEGCYAGDPWASDIADDLGVDDTAVLVGTGLTAIDAALLLDAAGFQGRILAISRRGLVPRAHAAMPPVRGCRDRPTTTLSALVSTVRRRTEAVGWRVAVDELRPVTQMLWGALSAAERRRFLRHLRPFWDIHRHRLAPTVAERIDALRTSGRLSFAAGKIVSAQSDGKGALLHWRPRGGDSIVETRARRIVNCTGPQGDLLRSPEPLIRYLLADGAIRPDALRIGLEVDAQSRVIAADGSVNNQLYSIGPMTRGGLWEVVAVPDIRQQNWTLARRLANAQWVGGEGL